MNFPIKWKDIEPQLNNITPVSGGFSMATRGLITLADGQQVFVKIGNDENTIPWANKEIQVYKYLKSQSFPAIPELVSVSHAEDGFALQALTAYDGWDWSDTWTQERLDATLAAMDELAKLKPINEPWMELGELALDETRDGWAPLKQSAELQQKLLDKLRTAGHESLASTLDFESQAARSANFVFRTDTLVHFDVRADNCAWNAATKQVRLVDWNWTQYGDSRMDFAAMLTHVQKAGLDVSKTQAARLDPDALQWMAGFWLKAATTPIWPGGPEHLRDFQLEAGITALSLSQTISSV